METYFDAALRHINWFDLQGIKNVKRTPKKSVKGCPTKKRKKKKNLAYKTKRKNRKKK